MPSREEELEEKLAKTRTLLKEVTRSYEDYRNLANFAPDIIWQIDLAGIITYVSPSVTPTLGYSVDETIGMAMTDLLTNDSAEHFKAVLDGGVGEEVLALSLTYQGKDGADREGEVRLHSYADLDGNLLGIQGMTRDVTDSRRMEQELRKVEKLEAIGLLAGGIAHDLNNFLTGIVGNISLARHAREESERERLLGVAEDEAMRVTDLTQQLLTFSKGGSPRFEPKDLASLVRRTISFATSGSAVVVECDFPDGACVAQVDEGQIKQVISNLTINAVQAMPGGGQVQAAIKSIVLDADNELKLTPGDFLELTYSDSGAGIPADQLQKIFDPFYTTKPSGNGLGLATSYAIIEKHGGAISVSSEVGVGTTFRILLPAWAGKPADEAQRKPDAPRVGGRVLFMDDETSIRSLAMEALGGAGHDVVACRDGTEAIDEFTKARSQGRPFSVVVLDLTIPGGKGGVQTLREILAIDPNAQCVLTSGYSANAAIAEYREHGFVRVLAKPFRLEDLTRMVGEVGRL